MRVRARLLVVGIVSWLPMQQQPKRTNATTALQQQQRRFCRRLIHRKVLDACTKHGRLVISVRDWSFASSLVIDNQDWPCGKSCWSFLHRTFRPFDIRAKNLDLCFSFWTMDSNLSWTAATLSSRVQDGSAFLGRVLSRASATMTVRSRARLV